MSVIHTRTESIRKASANAKGHRTPKAALTHVIIRFRPSALRRPSRSKKVNARTGTECTSLRRAPVPDDAYLADTEESRADVYNHRMEFRGGEAVRVCTLVREHDRPTWRVGTIAPFEEYPVRCFIDEATAPGKVLFGYQVLCWPEKQPL
ncbi:hypothetical protein BD413DRAFT_72033 [Trametes elegans]|nr:hypothetical protein BD413DRAFT_72033 [Trametes elegans]